MNTANAAVVSRPVDGVPPYTRLRFHFSLPAGAALPPWPGSAWRGAFGWALRELVCLTGQDQCGGCLLASECLYQRLFETAVAAAGQGVTTHAPHPFVLFVPDAGRGRRSRDGAVIELTLIGEACAALPLVVRALQRAGEGGIAGRRNRLRLWSVSQWHGGRWEPVLRPGWNALRRLDPEPLDSFPPYPGGALRVQLCSPLRIKHQGRLVGPDAFSPRIFVHALYVRLRRLCQFHGRPSVSSWPSVPEEARFRASRLAWYEVDRYSSRQGKKHRIGGLLGSFVLEIDTLESVWPLLWHGQFLHLGKCTSMGHGAYRLQLDTAPAC